MANGRGFWHGPAPLPASPERASRPLRVLRRQGGNGSCIPEPRQAQQAQKAGLTLLRLFFSSSLCFTASSNWTRYLQVGGTSRWLSTSQPQASACPCLLLLLLLRACCCCCCRCPPHMPHQCAASLALRTLVLVLQQAGFNEVRTWPVQRRREGGGKEARGRGPGGGSGAAPPAVALAGQPGGAGEGRRRRAGRLTRWRGRGSWCTGRARSSGCPWPS